MELITVLWRIIWNPKRVLLIRNVLLIIITRQRKVGWQNNSHKNFEVLIILFLTF